MVMVHSIKRKVFAENLNLISGIEVGMGGVWLGSAPNLLFIPIDAKNDKPAGPAQIYSTAGDWKTPTRYSITSVGA
jgi:hypothetical protein